MKSISLNNTNITYDNRIIKKFPTSVNFTELDQIAFNSLIIPHSFFNIDKELFNNNTIEISYNNQTTRIILDDGYYTIEDLNFKLQMETLRVTNNLPYCVSESGDYIYYYELIYNSTFYSCQLNVYPVVLPLKATNPKNCIFNLYCPQVKFIDNISEIIGLEQNILYPSIATRLTNYSIYSSQINKVPNFSPMNNILVTCNLINNSLDEPNNIIYNFSTNLSIYGSNITVRPNELIFFNIQKGSYNQIEINLLNAQDYRPIKIRDKNISMNFIIKQFSY